MRLKAVVAGAAVVILVTTCHSAVADDASVTEGLDGTAIQYDVTGETPGASTPPTAQLSAVGIDHGGPILYPIDNPEVVTQGGSLCVTYVVTWVTSQQEAETLTVLNERKAEALQGQWGVCSGAAAPPGAGGVPPGQAAANYWANQGSNPLLTPQPKIRPGWAVTGKTAYLETGGSTGQVFTDPTGAGPLQIQAAGQFWVDWGDGGGMEGPFDSTGGPYPDGTITHTWTTTGTYAVKVFETWTATWSLGTQGGQLAGLHTLGEIPGFTVRELVSVRNR